MPNRHHPDWINAYIDLFASRSEAPEAIHRWTAASVIAGATTRHIWIEERTFRYYPNLYLVIVSPPAIISKSTTVALGIDLLKELNHIYIGADNSTYPAFIQDLAKRQSDVQETFPADDMEADWIRQCAVTLPISEFGTFFKPEDEDMVNGLTDLFDCRPLIVKDTKTNGTDIVEHPFVNLIACTTPDWIRDKLKSSIGGWGLSSRIIFIHASEKVRLIPRPSKLWSGGQFEEGTKKLIDDLKEISLLAGPMLFSSDADIIFSNWYHETMDRVAEYNRKDDHNTWVSYFLGRKQVHVQKLAMILSISRGSSLVIEAEDLLTAIKQVDEAETEIELIFNQPLSPSPLALTEGALLDKLANEIGQMPRQKLAKVAVFNRLGHYVDSSMAIKMVDNALNRGVFKQSVEGGVTYVKLP